MRWTMQISYWTLGGLEGETPIADVLAAAKKMGYDGVELCFGAGELAPGVSEATCRAIRARARELGMAVDTLCTGTYWGQSLTHPRAAVRKKAIAFTREYLQVAKWIGAKTVLVIPGHVAVPFDPSQPVVPYATAWKYATQAVRAVLPTAKDLGVRIGLENVWNWFLTDPMAMKAFIDQFKGRTVGAYFDIANCLINGYPEHWIEILGKRIHAVHVKNFERQDCGGGLHGFGDDIAKGAADWKAVTKALKAVGYKGPITAEMIPFSRLPDLVLPDAKLARSTAKKLPKLMRG